jgi:hypothetical protein
MGVVASPRPIFTLCPTGPAKASDWFLISNRFLSRGLLIAQMMEAASISKTSEHLYQNTRRCNPEDSHLLKEMKSPQRNNIKVPEF